MTFPFASVFRLRPHRHEGALFGCFRGPQRAPRPRVVHACVDDEFPLPKACNGEEAIVSGSPNKLRVIDTNFGNVPAEFEVQLVIRFPGQRGTGKEAVLRFYHVRCAIDVQPIAIAILAAKQMVCPVDQGGPPPPKHERRAS